MNVTADLSFISLIGGASPIVKGVMGLLIFLSFWSWWQIFIKLFAIRRAAKHTDEFENHFWKGGDLNLLYQKVTTGQEPASGLERIFEAGFREFGKHKKQTISPSATMDSTRRAMRAAYQRELDYLEANLAGLASVGSVSLYIGLFGTVWGIMNAFRGLANVSQATLAQVAPGIAEALIATAIGLFTAIPAVIAYNHFTHNIDRLAVRFDTFMEEFSNILQRQATGSTAHANLL